MHEGVVPTESPDEAELPAWFDVYFGNTLVCAAAQTGNDLCHTWLNRDGTMTIYDQNGSHTGHWRAGKVGADGRVPLCRYWDLTDFALPAGVKPDGMPRAMTPSGPSLPPAPPPPVTPGAPRAVRICEMKNFHSVCTNYPDVGKLTPDLQRKASLTMVQVRHEDGACYSHGPHKVGEAWFEWADAFPGQLGLDREILLPGHQ